MFSEVIVRPAWFAMLASPAEGAAALPLVVREDVISDTYREVGYRHMDFFSLYLVRQGRGTHVIDGQGYAVARGDVYAMGPGQAHWFEDWNDLTLDTLHFMPSLFDASVRRTLSQTLGFHALLIEEPVERAQSSSAPGRWLHLTPDAYAPVAALVAELHAEWSACTPDGTLLARGLFLRLLVWLARAYVVRQTPQAVDSRVLAGPREAAVAAAVRLMDAQFAGQLRVKQVAAAAFMSPDHFTRVFTSVMGQTPRDYLRLLRLERAKLLLTETDTPVAVIAEQAGFGEAAYFARAFRDATGTTPRQFRRHAAK